MEKRLRALSQELRKQKLSGFIVPHTDEHQSEYTPSYAERLAWISGFDGSAGLAAITLNQAAIFVDGRYTLQVRNQVDRTLFSIMKLHEDQTEDWFLENLEEGAVIGYDPWLHSKIWLEKARNTLAAKNITLNALSKNPIDEIWQDRPAPSNALAQVYKLRYSGEKS